VKSNSLEKMVKCEHIFSIWSVTFGASGAWSHSRCDRCRINKVNAIRGSHSGQCVIAERPAKIVGQIDLFSK
jgi:hypothetical protein